MGMQQDVATPTSTAVVRWWHCAEMWVGE
jgi:hypothetical protein